MSAGAALRDTGAETLPSAISVEGVSKVFRRKNMTITALQDADLEIGAGRFVSLIGPSGCGKSTLLKAIAGLQPPSTGAVRVDGERVTVPLAEAGVAFQKPTLLPWRTVTENISLPFNVSGSISKEEGARRVDRLLEITGLQDFAQHYPRELSGGMEQRVAIARSLVLRPGLLLMDEPFGALDEFTREDLNEELLRIWAAEPKTVVFVTHSISEAVFLSDQIVVMSARPGRIFDVFDVHVPRPRTAETRTSPEFNELVAHTRRVLDQAH